MDSSGKMMTSGFDLHDRLIIVHAVCAAIVALFTVPPAILSVRILRPTFRLWFPIHMTMQILTVIFLTLTFALGTAAVMLGGNGSQFTGPKADRHHRLGLALYVIVLVQASLGVAAHFTRGRPGPAEAEKEHLKPKLSIFRQPVRFMHVGLGLVTCVLLYTQFWLGLAEWNMTSDNGSQIPRFVKITFWGTLGGEVAMYPPALYFEHWWRKRMMRVAAEQNGRGSVETEGEVLNGAPVEHQADAA